MKFLFCFAFILLLEKTSGSSLNKTVFVIMSQSQEYHSKVAELTETKIVSKLKEKGVQHPHVLLLHRDLQIKGNWAILPILPALNTIGGVFGDMEWFVFVPENAEINFKKFELVLSRYSSKDFALVGRLLKDEVPSMLHYQVLEDVQYPDLNAGFLMSKLLLRFLAAKLVLYQTASRLKPLPITLDASYELSKAILSPVMQQYKPKFFNESLLCPFTDDSCAIFIRKETCLDSYEQKINLLQKTLFAVKTCQQFHQTRLAVVQNTWAEFAANVIYASEFEDPKFGTKILAGGESNNPGGGPCLKVAAILRHFDKKAEINGWDWLVLVDDDAIFSVSKLLDVIGCYTNDTSDVIIGEVYGNEITPVPLETGFEYPSGGSGKAFNRASVKKLVQEDLENRCILSGTMEDFMLGRLLKDLNLTVVRNSRLHQFRPQDYPDELLRYQDPISFHKFVGTNPFETYNTWFRRHDEEFRRDLNMI